MKISLTAPLRVSCPPAPLRFLVRCIPNTATFYHLTLLDEQGLLGHWVLAQPTDQLAHLPPQVLLVPTDPTALRPLEAVEEGEAWFGPELPTTADPAARRAYVAQGRLRLEFRGDQLRGQFSLRRAGPHAATAWWLESLPEPWA